MGTGMSLVLPGLFVGSFRSSRDLELLKKNQITHIVSVHDNAKPLEKHIKYLCIVASDKCAENILLHFPKVNDFIHDARINGGVVLVHCLAGVSRSVTLVTAYIMTVTDLNWQESLNVVKGCRFQANPNFGFKTQLKEYEFSSLKDERGKFRARYPCEGEITLEKDAEACRNLLEKYNRWVHYGDRLQMEDESALVERIVESKDEQEQKHTEKNESPSKKNSRIAISYFRSCLPVGRNEKVKQSCDDTSVVEVTKK